MGVPSGRRKRVMQLYRSAGCHDCRCEQRRDVADGDEARPGGRRTATGSRRAGTRCTGAGAGTTARCGGAAATAEAEQVRDHAERADRRDHRGELAADAANLRAECAAGGALVHVTPSETAGTDAAVVREDQFLADLDACRIACLGRLREADARADEQRFDGGDGGPERAGDVGVGHPAEFAHQQRRALLLGKLPHVPDQLAQRVPLLGLEHRVAGRCTQDPQDLRCRRDRPAQLVDAAVVGDAVQPRAERQLPVIGPQTRVRADEHVLECVLGIRPRAGEHLPRVGEQPLPVTVVDRPERLIVAVPEQLDQLLVGTQPQQRNPEPAAIPSESCLCLKSGGFHGKFRLPRL
jgi:hypothetical protein